MTWCVRADPALAGVAGSAAWLLETRAALWDELEQRGHEIGWHVHLQRLDRSTNRFVPALEPAAFPRGRAQERVRRCLPQPGGCEASARAGTSGRTS